MKKRIYISGKITGLTADESSVKFNTAAKFIKAFGYLPVNPIELCNEKNIPNTDYSKRLLCCIEELIACDGIFFLDNWYNSTGAVIERHVAGLLHRSNPNFIILHEEEK
jgi:hypothetical protein